MSNAGFRRASYGDGCGGYGCRISSAICMAEALRFSDRNCRRLGKDVVIARYRNRRSVCRAPNSRISAVKVAEDVIFGTCRINEPVRGTATYLEGIRATVVDKVASGFDINRVVRGRGDYKTR